jgi:hypothetical protein
MMLCCLPAAGRVPEGESVESAALPELVQGVQVGVDVVGIVAECSIVLAGPVLK